MFSCALPPGVTAGIIKALEIARDEPELRKRLWDNVHFAQDKLRGAGVDIGDSESQVIPVMIRDDKHIFSYAEQLIHEGVYLNPVRFPAVGKHRSRFRISISAGHTNEQLDRGCDILINVMQRHGLCR